MKIKLFVLSILICFANVATAQTASSLFSRNDSLQVKEIISKAADMFDQLGHNGPAVENSHMAMRIYFNDSGAIDLYSKTSRGMELHKYKWYPSSSEIEENGAGHDSYKVGNTLGFGGIALWDGEKIVRLSATRGRTARVGDSSRGSFAEMISYGVICGGDTLDISLKVEVLAKKREAKITARELNGKKVSFVTGINFWENQKVVVEEDFAFVWGVHQHEGIKLPIGAGIKFSAKKFAKVEQTQDMIRLVSFPATSITTTLVGASTLEAELNSLKRFETYMRK